MKQVQIDALQSGLEVSATGAATAVQVSGVGPLTVAVQVSVSAQSSANFTGQLQGSLDGTNFFNVGSSQNITANGELGFSDTAVAWAYYRILFTRTAGSFTAAIRTFVYGKTV